MSSLFRVPVLSRRRILMAFTVAVAADAIQLAIGPLGWFIFDEILDVFAMAATILLLGFHPLLLPTFIIELVPIVDMLPTWTGCVGAVVLLRKRQQRPPPVPTGMNAKTQASANADGDVIDV